MKDLNVLILIGPPGSGKTTWSDNFISKNDNWVVIGRDPFRFMLKNRPVCEPKIEDLITGLMNNALTSSLSMGLNVIVDNTNLKQRYINDIIKVVDNKATINYRLFDVPLKTCIERDLNRDKKVGEEIIRKMYKDFLIIKDSLDYSQIPAKKDVEHFVEKQNTKLKECVIFDIDGTIAFCGNRNIFDFKKVEVDIPNYKVIELIHFHKDKGREIIFLSGRDAVCYHETVRWIHKYVEITDFKLLMRPKDDRRKDNIVKKELYDVNIKDKYYVHSVIDDRLQVLKTWQDLGLYTFDVGQGKIF